MTDISQTLTNPYESTSCGPLATMRTSLMDHTATHLIELYLTHIAGRSFSEFTIRRRRGSLGRFAAFIHPTPLLLADGANIEEWLQQFGAARTKHAYRSDLAAFFSWAVRRHILDSSPVADTDPIRVPRGMPRPVPSGSVRMVIGCATDETLQVALALAAYAGLRRSEITHLSTDDISLASDPAQLVVRNGKGGKDRIVPVHPELARLLARQRQGRVVPWTADALGRRASAHIRACGFNNTIHNLRATFGTELSRVTKGNVMLVKELMGHASAETTTAYIGLAGIVGASKVATLYT